MSASVQATIDEYQSTILVIAPESVFATQLCTGIRSLHLHPVHITPEEIIANRATHHDPGLWQSAYACVWVDLPVFAKTLEKQRLYSAVLQKLLSSLQIPLYCAVFDAFYGRKIGREGELPTTNPIETIKHLYHSQKNVKVFAYQHVVYPYEAGASIVVRFLLEKIGQGNCRPLLGTFTPIHFSDVLAHLLRSLYDTASQEGVYTGSKPISLEEFERLLRVQTHQPSLGGLPLEFPFVFKAGSGIGQIPTQSLVEELTALVPKKSESLPADVPKKTVFTQTKRKVQKSPKASLLKRISRSIILSCSVVLVGYIVGVIYILLSLSTHRGVMMRIASNQGSVGLLSGHSITPRSIDRLELLVRTIPIPYQKIGLHIQQEGVIAGLESTKSLFGALASVQGVQHSLFDRQADDGGVDAYPNPLSSLEESTKSLSMIQSQIAKGDLILDALYGVDGLSEQLYTSIIAIREEISQTKAITMLLSSVFQADKPTTIALVSMDASVSRPLIGIPAAVTLITLEQGRVSSVQELSIQELDQMLKGNVELPEEISRFISPQHGWKLSDGAWSVDGAVSGRQLVWFIGKQTRTPIDYAVFVKDKSLTRVHALLSASTLEGGNQAAVLGVGSEEHSVFPFSIALSKIQSTHTRGRLWDQLLADLKQGEIVVHAQDSDTKALLKGIGWDGSLSTPSCPIFFQNDRECVVLTRYLAQYSLEPRGADGVVEKTNQIHKLTLHPDSVEHIDEVLYSNTQTADEKTLLKYVVDEQADQLGVWINGQLHELATEDVRKEYGKTTVSIVVNLQAEQQTSVVLRYHTEAISPTKSSLVFFAQKQVGREKDPLSVVFTLGQGYAPKIVAPPGRAARGVYVFDTTLETSKLFALGF